MRRARLALLLALVPCGTGAASAEDGRHNAVPVSRAAGDTVSASLRLFDAASGSWAPVNVENPGLGIGDRVAVCATARVAGYLSVWSRTDDGALPARVFPNDFTPEQRAERGGRIGSGQEICLGDGTGGYRFTVTPPVGAAEVYVYWSPDLAGQFGPEDIPIIPEHGTADRAASGGYSATVLRYRVVQ